MDLMLNDTHAHHCKALRNGSSTPETLKFDFSRRLVSRFYLSEQSLASFLSCSQNSSKLAKIRSNSPPGSHITSLVGVISILCTTTKYAAQ